jgi:pyrroloquinoline quinone biosynthesis protein D
VLVSTLKPRGRGDVVARSFRRQRVLYDSVGKTSHVLNETAEFIWNLCDGRHSVEDISREIKEHFEVPPGIDIEEDVRRTLLVLKKKGLLVPAGNGRDH